MSSPRPINLVGDRPRPKIVFLFKWRPSTVPSSEQNGPLPAGKIDDCSVVLELWADACVRRARITKLTIKAADTYYSAIKPQSGCLVSAETDATDTPKESCSSCALARLLIASLGHEASQCCVGRVLLCRTDQSGQGRARRCDCGYGMKRRPDKPHPRGGLAKTTEIGKVAGIAKLGMDE
ncbi:unnamed protein product [Protopolystoma xenopodis]|uniref:Uncharacterized protein n=1 Tax=Protopolystoma xenopodis TaxID=117903 RepID=A0A3S5BLW9_9PLAT|nr:unnamed protein product [Protopolystoma xenopodis]